MHAAALQRPPPRGFLRPCPGQLAATHTAAKMSAPVRVDDPTLPAPWQALSAGSLTYYWNPQTNVTQYDRPAGSAAPQVDVFASL